MIEGLSYRDNVVTISRDLYIHLIGLAGASSIYGAIAEKADRVFRLVVKYHSRVTCHDGVETWMFNDSDIAYSVYALVFEILKK